MRAKRGAIALALAVLAAGAVPCLAATPVSGTIRDPQGAPLPGVAVRVSDTASEFSRETTTDAQGQYVLPPLDAGQYTLTATLQGFKVARVALVVTRRPVVADLQLELGTLAETVTVNGQGGERLVTHSTTLVTRRELQHIPGALEAGSYAAILETTPSAVLAHDLLHVRGGHQIGFEVDGVPVPSNTVGTNFSLLFEPKDVKALEFQRGSYQASMGDRMYGVFNVVTRSGFERARGGEALLIGGQQSTMDAAVSYGDHTDTVAYFVQGSANRTDFGLTPPAPDYVHDRHSGGGAAGKLWMVPAAEDVFTVTGSVRGDDYQIPQDAAAADPLLSVQEERDVFVNALWTHSGRGRAVWSAAPYYHLSRVALLPDVPGAADASSDDRHIHYAGAKVDWSLARGAHSIQVGTNTYGSFLRDTFGFAVEGGDAARLADTVAQSGLNTGVYAQDQVRLRRGVTLDAGLRWDYTNAHVSESFLQPRVGIVAALGNTDLTAHAYGGRLFQAPPLGDLGLAGSEAAAAAGQMFVDVRGERDTLWEAGLSWTHAGFIADATYYLNQAHDYLDHEQVGESAVFLPVNIDRARLRGLELSLSSPSRHGLSGRVVYAYGHAEGRGGITGGLGDIEREETEDAWFFLDHDQRHTLSVSADLSPSGAPYWAHATVRFGSGFLLEEGPDHLPSYGTLDLSAGWAISRRLELAAEVQNLTDNVYLISLSSEFNGTHYARPRYISGRLRVTF